MCLFDFSLTGSEGVRVGGTYHLRVRPSFIHMRAELTGRGRGREGDD